MIQRILIGVLVFAAGAGTVAAFTLFEVDEGALCAQQFPLTDPGLDCKEYTMSRDRMTTLSNAINELATTLEADSRLEDVSVWVRDLTTRQWAAYKEDEDYDPASIGKVPLMMAYFKIAELDPTVMEQTVPYEQKSAIAGLIPPKTALEVGKEYSVSQLIEHMILQSDNSSMEILKGHITYEVIYHALQHFGMLVKSGGNELDFASAKTVANVFRSLYNASYLDRPTSNQVLELLTKTEYPGIKAPLPANVKVAHKFGERELERSDGTFAEIQLHDCGIVYKESTPYTLCVMTRGTDLTYQQDVLEKISKLVYDHM